MSTTDKPTIEFDHFSTDYAQNWREIVQRNHETCPVAWTEAHGGFWLLSNYEDVTRAARDWETFSAFNAVSGPGKPQGVLIPPSSYQFPLGESDPPRHGKLRILEAPFFTPRNLHKASEVAAHFAREQIEIVKKQGGGDVVHDLGIPIPARTTLKLVGIPDGEWRDYALPAHKGSYTPHSSPDFPGAEIAEIVRRLNVLVAERRENPRDDIITAVANGKVGGELIEAQTASGMLLALCIGGFDTMTSHLSHAMLWLDDHRDVWPVLLEDEKLLENAIEEFLRVFPPVHGAGRSVVKDVTLSGQDLKPGERIMTSWAAANQDPVKFECPMEVRLDRPNARDHMAFGGGNHRCLGSPLAKIESRMVLRMVMTEIPNYRIDKAGVRRYPTAGLVNGFNAMPFTLE